MDQPEAATHTPRLSSQAKKPSSKPDRTKKVSRLIAILVVVIFLCLIGIVEAYRHNRTNPSSNTAAPVVTGKIQSAQVSVTSSGFTPQTVQVPLDTQVTWTNNDNASHEVAADPYPKDSSIPGFNNNVLLHKGDSYSFIFSKAGTYTYHDELNPFKFQGTVVVTSN